MDQRIPPGDDRLRSVCLSPTCDTIAYHNPKVVVATVPTSPDGKRVLLTRRAIPPVGGWTIPAGFLEAGETTEKGAAREAWEEAGATLELDPLTLLAVYNVLPANQIQLVYRAVVLNEPTLAPGLESSDVCMFPWAEVPWDQLAFPTVEWALRFEQDHVGHDITRPDLRTR